MNIIGQTSSDTLKNLKFSNMSLEQAFPETATVAPQEIPQYGGEDPGGYTPQGRILYWYHPDYIQNVDLITDIDGAAYELFLYNPWGEQLHHWTSSISSWTSPYRFNAKELDPETGLSYYGARYYQCKLGVWLSVDPMAHEREWLTPYNFVSKNPINIIDPDGRLDDWVERTDDNGNTSIFWDENVTGANDADLQQGDRYLGKAVVVFEGSESEKLGKGDNLFGEGANLAKATVYGPDGPDDIKEYGAYTMSSDPSIYGTVADGEYNVYYDKVGKSGALKSNWAVEGRGKVPARGGVNPAYPSRDPGYLNGVFIHRSNNNGYAGGGVSKGCPLICPSLNNPGNGWDEFNQQLQGVSRFKMILKRD
jgi:RHS repeat-associated protein